MHIDVITLFPELFAPPPGYQPAREGDRRGEADGRTSRPAPIRSRPAHVGGRRALRRGGRDGDAPRADLRRGRGQLDRDGSHVILLSPRGTRLDHGHVARLSEEDHLILICGRYEGVDERVSLHLVGRGDLDRRLRAGGRRAPRSGDHRSRIEVRPRRPRQPGIPGLRVPRRRDARVPAVHAAPRVPRTPGPRRAPFRGSRGRSRMAQGPIGTNHPTTTTRPISKATFRVKRR